MAASISRMANRISTEAIAARSFDTTRKRMLKAGACKPIFKTHRMQNTDAVSAPVIL